MAQLAATGIMTLVRALIRRGISTKPYTRKLEEGFELNWLARALLKGPENFGPRPKKNAECTEPVTQQPNQGTASTISAPGRAKTVYLESTLGVIAGGNPKLCVRNKSEKPMSLVKIRQNLGRLSQWRSLASEPAVTVANAIEVVMNTLFRFEDGITTFSWFMDVQLEGADGKSQDSESHHEQVSLTVKKDNASKSWIAIPEEVEALLSLWFQHAHDAECNEKQLRINPTSASNDWLRRKPQKKNMRFLGPDTPALRRDLQWWLPDGVRSLLQVKNGTPLNEGRTLQAGSDPVHHVIDYHRITGFHAPEDLLKSPCSAIHFDCGPVPSDWLTVTPHETQQISTETLTAMVKSNEITCIPTAPEITTEKPSYGRKEDCTALGMITGISRELLFAQHIFTAFMSEVATKIDRIRGESKANQRAMKNHPTAWQHFRLENTDVSTIALGVKDTGLGTFEEALLCIIPPLSLSNRLPVGAAVDLVLRNMEGDENVLNWEKSQEVYEELLNFGTRFHSASCLFTVRAAAAAVECVRRMQDMEELYADNSKDPDAERLQGAKEKILGGLRNLISDDVKKLLQELYKRQKREHEYRWFMRLQHESSETPKIPQMYGDSEDEASATSSSSTVISKETPGPAKGPAPSSIEGETFLDGDDITKALGYSPLHSYIVSSVDNGMDDKLRRYVNEGDILAWRPLHYAVKYEGNYVRWVFKPILPD